MVSGQISCIGATLFFWTALYLPLALMFVGVVTQRAADYSESSTAKPIQTA